jgi:hypothetical protein
MSSSEGGSLHPFNNNVPKSDAGGEFMFTGVWTLINTVFTHLPNVHSAYFSIRHQSLMSGCLPPTLERALPC